MSGSGSGLAFATVAGSLEEHDVVHGIVLPKVLDEHPDLTHRQREYAKPDLKTSDFTFAPVRFNHNYKKNHTGVTIAWRVREVYQASANLLEQPGTVRVETLHKMHAEPDDDNQSAEANFQRSQREMLMRGIHRGLSLGHSYNTAFLGDAGVVDASQAGKPGILVNKNIIEISTCKRGKRDGSEILEYLPCRRSLERSRESEIREFVDVYHYTAPAVDLHSSDTARWRSYIDHLWSEVDQRRKALVSEPGYAQSLRARGVVAASADTDEWLEAVASLPWSFLADANGTQPDYRQTTMSTPVGSNQPAATTSSASQQQPPVAASTSQQPAGATNTAPALNQTGAPQGSSSMMAVDTPPTAPPPGGYQAEAAQQAANNFAAYKQQKEAREAAERRAAELETRLAEFESRDNESRKRKQQDDEEREKAAFLAKKEELRAGIMKSGALSKENGTEPQKVDRFVNDQLSDLNAIGTLSGLLEREQRFGHDCETLVSASASARNRFEEAQRAEWSRQRREIESTLSAQPASSIMSSGGYVANQPAASSSSGNRFSFADWNTQQQPANGAVSTTNYAPAQTQGTVLASANSFSFLTGGHQSRSLDTTTPAAAAKKKPELPAVDVTATDNIGQALDHMIYKSANAGTFVLPSRHQLLLLGTNTETRVLNSANGPVEESREVPRLQYPLPETSYSWKTTAPELHEKLTLEVKKLLANGSNRISPADMNEMYRAGRMNEHGQAVNMIPFGGPMEQDGWSAATMDQWRSSRGYGANRRAVF